MHDGHISCYRTLATVNSAAMNMEYRYLFEMLISFPLDIHPEAGLLGHMVLFFLIYKFIYFIYFWLCWVFIVVRGLLIVVASLVAEHGL